MLEWAMPKSSKHTAAASKVLTWSSPKEVEFRQQLREYFDECPIPPNELLTNLGLFLNRQTLSRILFMHELYRKIINVHGIVAEFGTRWGQNLALFSSFRGMYEPFNHTRKIVGFDTFEGFTRLSSQDRKCESITEGGYAVSQDYEAYLEGILSYHEQESPLSHMRKFQIVKGDVSATVPKYLSENPETIIALAYFDLDLYEPTRNCLEAIKDYVTRGTVLGFDELNHAAFPGETVAVREVLGTRNYRIERSPLVPSCCWIVIE